MANGRRAPTISFEPNAEQRTSALEDVRFEVEQFADLLTHLRSISKADVALRRAVVERLLLHCRVLVPFFEAEERTVTYAGGIRQENDDVLARDYGFPSSPLPLPAQSRKALGRLRASLAYSGINTSSARSHWDVLALALPLLRRCAEFAKHVITTADLSPDARSAWDQLARNLEPFTAAGTDSLHERSPGPVNVRNSQNKTLGRD